LKFAENEKKEGKRLWRPSTVCFVMSEKPFRKDPYAALRIRDFRIFISARFFLTLATHIQAVVVGWQIYALTNDPFLLGLIGLAEAVPSICVSLYAGHVADIIPRKKIIIVALTTMFLCSGALFIFTLGSSKFLILHGTFPIYIPIFVSGIARGFLTPANFSFMPQLVPRPVFGNAITWNSTVWQTASISGLSIGGFLYGFVGVTRTYAVDVCLMLIALLLYVSIQGKPLPEATLELGVREKILAGLRFVFKNQVILGALSLDLFAVLFGGAVALLPIFADAILHVGAQGLGILRAAPGVGAVVMAIYFFRNPLQSRMGKTLLGSVAGFGLCMILFALSTDFWLSLFLLVVSGAFDYVSVIVRSTLLQTLTPENMKGRVSAVNNIFIGSSNEIGAFESGVTAKFIGTIPSVIFGGCMTILVVFIIGWKATGLRRLQKVS
jgi:MFS family permease